VACQLNQRDHRIFPHLDHEWRATCFCTIDLHTKYIHAIQHARVSVRAIRVIRVVRVKAMESALDGLWSMDSETLVEALPSRYGQGSPHEP